MTRIAAHFPLSYHSEPTKGYEFSAYPSVNSFRWLFPADCKLNQITSNFYYTTGFGAKLKRFLMQTPLAPRERVWISTNEYEQLLGKLSYNLGRNDIFLAFYNGALGPSQKVTAQIMSHDGQVLAYAKFARLSGALSALHKEQANLELLSRNESLCSMIPTILNWEDIQGNKMLVTSASPTRLTAKNLTSAHIDFLTTLGNNFSDLKPLLFSPAWQEMVQRFERMKSLASPGLMALYESSLSLIYSKMHNVEMPFSFAHGDFAPWNIRLDSKRFFIFDWELGQNGVSPLYDAFHFYAIQSAASGKNFFPHHNFFQDLLSRIWPDNSKFLIMLYIIYLTDVSMKCLEAEITSQVKPKNKLMDWSIRHLNYCLNPNNKLVIR